jgi:hypothetical protein
VRLTFPSAECSGRFEPNREAASDAVVECAHILRGIRVDDWVFGVSTGAADGSESPVASAVPGGAFAPYTPPPPRPQQ